MDLDFSPAADDEWKLILQRDVPLARVIDPILDDVESGKLPGQMRTNHVRYTTVRVPGRDDLYAIVWEIRDDHYYVTRVGRVS